MDDTAIVYSGIDGRLFTAPDDAPEAAAASWGGRLLYVGRYDPRKGIETAIRALTHLDAGTTLEVQGTGDPAERDRMASLAAELGLGDRVEFGSVDRAGLVERSEEHTSELQSLMRSSYAVFCLKKTNTKTKM